MRRLNGVVGRRVLKRGSVVCRIGGSVNRSDNVSFRVITKEEYGCLTKQQRMWISQSIMRCDSNTEKDKIEGTEDRPELKKKGLYNTENPQLGDLPREALGATLNRTEKNLTYGKNKNLYMQNNHKANTIQNLSIRADQASFELPPDQQKSWEDKKYVILNLGATAVCLAIGFLLVYFIGARTPTPQSIPVEEVTMEETGQKYFRLKRDDQLRYQVAYYQMGFPFIRDDPTINDHTLFFQNKIKDPNTNLNIEKFLCLPPLEQTVILGTGDHIHLFFPCREEEVSMSAGPLQPHEMQDIQNDPEAMRRYLRVYTIAMESLFAIKINPETGAISKAPKWKQLRTTDSPKLFNKLFVIIRSLGEFGLEDHKEKLMHFLVNEVTATRELSNMARFIGIKLVPLIRNAAYRDRLERLVINQLIADNPHAEIVKVLESSQARMNTPILDQPQLQQATPIV